MHEINKQIKILLSHETRLSEIMHRFIEDDKKLNFAFFFASPLVLNCEQTTKLMPTLKYDKEFQKIKESLSAAQVKLTLT